MTKFKSQALHIIRIKYWKASGSGNPPSLIPALRKIAILGLKTKFSMLFCRRLYMQWLKFQVRNLESVLAEMHKAAENRREIERQHKEALENLKRKQEEVENVATSKQLQMIEQLKLKITDLEVDRNAQNERHQELILEMAEMKKYGPESIASDMEAPCDNLEIDQIMAKLEQDNKFLEDLEKQRSSKAVNKANSDSSSSSSSGNNQRFVK